jgi:hypothetical protein
LRPEARLSEKPGFPVEDFGSLVICADEEARHSEMPGFVLRGL